MVIVVILIAFGFVLNAYLDLLEEVQEYKKQIGELTVKLEKAITQLEIYQQEKAGYEEKIQELEAAKATLELNITVLKAEIEELNRQLNQLTFEKAMLQSNRSILDFIEQNPYLLVGALLTQATTSVLSLRKGIARRALKRKSSSQTEYVRLSRDELADIVSRRRNGVNRQ
jgi:chromosome segregation ATPase